MINDEYNINDGKKATNQDALTADLSPHNFLVNINVIKTESVPNNKLMDCPIKISRPNKE